MALGLLLVSNMLLCRNNIMINSKVSYWIVNWVSLVLLLWASCAGADWIASLLELEELELGINVWYDELLFLLVPLWSPFMTELGLGVLEVLVGGEDVVINTEVWYWVVNWVALVLLLWAS